MNSVHRSANSFVNNRRKSEGTIITPGPASYYISRDMCKRSISFTRATKTGDTKKLSPGPGSYNIPCEFGNGPRAVIPSGKASMEPAYGPGPSDYSPKYEVGSIKYSFPKKKYEDKKEITPGPGDYEVMIKSTAPKVSIGRARRLFIDVSNEAKGISLKNKIGSSSSKNSKKSGFTKSFDAQGCSLAKGSLNMHNRESSNGRSRFLASRRRSKENSKPPRAI